MGAFSAEGKRTVFGFEPDCLPAYVQVLDRAGECHGLKVLMAWQSSEDGVTWGGDELRFHWGAAAADDAESDSTGDERLRLIGGGWEFENTHYRARVARNRRTDGAVA